MLGQRRRRWLNIKPTVVQCVVFSGYSFSNVWPLTISSKRGWHAFGHFGKIRSNWHGPTKNYRWLQNFEIIHPTELSKTHIFDILWSWGSSVAMATMYGLKCDSKRKSMSTLPGQSLGAMFYLWRNKACLKWKMAQNNSGMKRLNCPIWEAKINLTLWKCFYQVIMGRHIFSVSNY